MHFFTNRIFAVAFPIPFVGQKGHWHHTTSDNSQSSSSPSPVHIRWWSRYISLLRSLYLHSALSHLLGHTAKINPTVHCAEFVFVGVVSSSATCETRTRGRDIPTWPTLQYLSFSPSKDIWRLPLLWILTSMLIFATDSREGSIDQWVSKTRRVTPNF